MIMRSRVFVHFCMSVDSIFLLFTSLESAPCPSLQHLTQIQITLLKDQHYSAIDGWFFPSANRELPSDTEEMQCPRLQLSLACTCTRPGSRTHHGHHPLTSTRTLAQTCTEEWGFYGGCRVQRDRSSGQPSRQPKCRSGAHNTRWWWELKLENCSREWYSE